MIQIIPSQQEQYIVKIFAPILQQFTRYRVMQLKIVRSTINSYLLHLANNDKSLVTKTMAQAMATSKNHNDAMYNMC